MYNLHYVDLYAHMYMESVILASTDDQDSNKSSVSYLWLQQVTPWQQVLSDRMSGFK